MEKFCLRGNSKEKERCLDLEKLETFPSEDYDTVVRSLPPEKSFVFHTRYEAVGLLVSDIYDATIEGHPVEASDLAALLGGTAPSPWQPVAIDSWRLISNGTSADSSSCPSPNPIFNFEFRQEGCFPTYDFDIVSSGHIYNLPLFDAADDGYGKLHEQASLVGIQIFYSIVDSLKTDFREMYEQWRISADCQEDRERLKEDSGNGKNDFLSMPPPGIDQKLLLLQSDLEGIKYTLGISSEVPLKLAYDPETNALQETNAYFLKGKSGEKTNIVAVGDSFLENPGEKQMETLGHELGHFRSLLWRSQGEGRDIIETALEDFSGVGECEESFRQAVFDSAFDGTDPEDEIYADIVLTEYENRLGGIDELAKYEHALYHLDIMQNKWPRDVAVAGIYSLISLFSRDPLLSEKTQETACSFLRENLDPDIREKVGIYQEWDSDPAADDAAGIIPFACRL